MQAMWRGAISVGVLSMEVAMYAATNDRGYALRTAHKADGGAIRHRKVCEVCGQEVAAGDIVRCADLPTGGYVTVDEDERAGLRVDDVRAIELVSFVRASSIDPMHLGAAYYLQPRGVVKPYVALRNALRATRRVGVARVTLRQRERLVVVRATGDLLTAQTMAFASEVRPAEFTGPQVTVSRAEAALARELVESMGADELDPTALDDRYRAGVERLVAAKVAGGDVAGAVGPASTTAPVADLMARLSSSVARASRRGRGRTGAAGGSGKRGRSVA